ncbi:glycosyltransferase [Sutcliffiella horikoshii]|uniref:glycosyltransferase n=1 Tax=Sutcliffiella horikoshii TaxID=79883 RepID=UPI00384E9CEE
MHFSVLMPVYNGDKPEFIQQAMDSIIKQTLQPSEIIVVVDGKVNDEIQDVLNQFTASISMLKILYLEENKGLGYALAYGVNNCRYEIIARMDSDDICRLDRFEKQISYLENNPKVDVVGSYIIEFVELPREGKYTKKVPINQKDILKYSKKRNPINHMTVIFKKSAVLDVGNYERFLWFEDYFLWVKMLKKGKLFHNIPESLVYARTGHDMYMRRGGFQYLVNDVKLQWNFYKSGYINFYQYLRNIVVRSIVRIIPNNLRSKVYKTLLR